MSTNSNISTPIGNNIHGSGCPVFAWNQDGSLIAVCGHSSQNLYIMDKRGRKLKETHLPTSNTVLSIDWDKDNDMIVVLQEGMQSVFLWNINQNKQENMELDTSKVKATFAKWSKTHPTLAVGTDKGSLLFYNKRTQKKIPTMGKHSKKIVSGDWNQDGLLREDKILTISNHMSDTLSESISIKSDPKDLNWMKLKTDDRNEKQNTICSIIQQKTLLLMDVMAKSSPLELVFESKYGKIIGYSVFGDGYIVIGFHEGYVCHISTHMKEMQNEVQSERIFNSTIDCIETNDNLYKLAVAGEGCIKIYNLANWKENKNERITLNKNVGKVVKMQWSQNGQILICSTSNGNLLGFSTSVPFVFSHHQNLTAVLSSFTQIDIFQKQVPHLTQNNEIERIAQVNLETEPNQISLSNQIVVTSAGNQASFYKWSNSESSSLILQKDYSSIIKKIQINQTHCCVLLDSGKLVLHQISNQYQEKKFPENDNDKNIVSFCLTQHFLIYIDALHRLRYYNVQDQVFILDFKKEITIQKVFPNNHGTKLVLLDTNNKGYLFQTKEESIHLIKDWPSNCQNVLWDAKDNNLFTVLKDDKIYPYIVINSIKGVEAVPIYEYLYIDQNDPQKSITIIDRSIKPIQINNGNLIFLSQNGQINSQFMHSHSHLEGWNPHVEKENHYRYFLQNLALNRLGHCLMAAQILEDQSIYNHLGKIALENLQIPIAQCAYKSAQNVSIVMAIQQFQNVTEKNVIYGQIAMLLGQFDKAQEYFLSSTQPQLALDMRCDIQDWITALDLAYKIDPKQVPLICKKLAFLIESQGNFHEAQRQYEKSFLKEQDSILNKEELQKHNLHCFAGIARTAIKLGDISRGFSIAQDIKDPQLVIEIAMVCENMNQSFEAAQLYEKAGLAEKAATLYIQLKMFKYVGPLMKNIKNSKLLIMLAKAKESEQSLEEAEQAFEQAEDWENVVRLNITSLNDVSKAKYILRNKCQSQACANMLSSYCVKKGEHAEAIEFLLLAGKKEEAFIMAQTYDEISAYANWQLIQISLKDQTPEESLQIAQYYEGKNLWADAAKYYEKSGNQSRALKLYKQAGDDYIETMIEMVGKAKKDNLTNALLDYLMGEDDYGEPKDPIYTYKIYRILKLYKQAAKISLTIANQEQESGDYKAAHYMLLETFKDMRKQNIKVPIEITNKLQILHSYIQVKRIIKSGNHEHATWLLNRVCKNISQFQQHAVNILTTAVIEATKANLKDLAYNWACVLVRPEYRQLITEKYKGKIESIARRPVNQTSEQAKSKCPFCQTMINEFDLDCQQCQNTLPYCIASGKHILRENCVFCKNCGFPANYEALVESLQQESMCNMCGEPMDIDNLEIVQNAQDQLRNWIKVGDDEEK